MSQAYWSTTPSARTTRFSRRAISLGRPRVLDDRHGLVDGDVHPLPVEGDDAEELEAGDPAEGEVQVGVRDEQRGGVERPVGLAAAESPAGETRSSPGRRSRRPWRRRAGRGCWSAGCRGRRGSPCRSRRRRAGASPRRGPSGRPSGGSGTAGGWCRPGPSPAGGTSRRESAPCAWSRTATGEGTEAVVDRSGRGPTAEERPVQLRTAARRGP